MKDICDYCLVQERLDNNFDRPPTLKERLMCIIGRHIWSKPRYIYESACTPRIVRASLEYMNAGKRQVCVVCGKARNAR